MNIVTIIREVYWIYGIVISYIKFFLRNLRCTQLKNSSCLIGKTAVVTGGNKGIGYATSVLLASRGCKVILACRSDASVEKDNIIKTTDNPNIAIEKLDLTSFRSVRAFAENLRRKECKIDILINNAGINASDDEMTEDGLDPIMQTNYFGPFLLTHLLSDLLKASTKARIIFISSSSVHLNRLSLSSPVKIHKRLNSWKILLRYSKSKLCSLIATQIFAEKFNKENISVNAVDPGFVKTAIYDIVFEIHGAKWKRFFIEAFFFFFSVDIFYAAQCIINLATSEELGAVGGKLFFQNKTFPKPKICEDEKFCEKLWSMTEDLVHLKPREKLK